MWQSSYQTTTHISAAKLYAANIAINRWHEWHDDIEYASIAGPCVAGAKFVLKPRGGPKVNITVERADEPSHFVDISHLFLAKMRTSHIYIQQDSLTNVCFTVEVWGPLAFLWRKTLAEGQIKKAPHLAQRLTYFAENEL